jgi:hypothetical protein
MNDGEIKTITGDEMRELIDKVLSQGDERRDLDAGSYSEMIRQGIQAVRNAGYDPKFLYYQSSQGVQLVQGLAYAEGQGLRLMPHPDMPYDYLVITHEELKL